MAVVCQCIIDKDWGGRILHLQPGWDAGSGCLPALLYPAGIEGLGMHLTVFAPAQRFPRGQTAAADPRSAHDQTWAQMFHPGAVWRRVAHRYLSDARLTAGAGRKRVSVLRTSQTLTTLHLSWHSSRGIGLTLCHNSDRQGSWRDNEMLQWGQSFQNQKPSPCDAYCWTRGKAPQATAQAYISVFTRRGKLSPVHQHGHSF